MRVYVIDLSGWCLVGLAGAVGAYAIYLFNTKVSAGLAAGIVSLFVQQ